jgi:co-chaperonin GroES (HSP10)
MTRKSQLVQILSTEFQPKNEYILVKPQELDKGEKKTESGLIIAIQQNTSALDRPTSGVVVSVGSDIEDIKEGDFILWPDTDGLDLEFIDGPFMLLRYKSVSYFENLTSLNFLLPLIKSFISI